MVELDKTVDAKDESTDEVELLSKEYLMKATDFFNNYIILRNVAKAHYGKILKEIIDFVKNSMKSDDEYFSRDELKKIADSVEKMSYLWDFINQISIVFPERNLLKMAKNRHNDHIKFFKPLIDSFSSLK
jgi:hypothetical protein